MTHCGISGRTRLLKWNTFQGAFSIYLCTFVHIILLNEAATRRDKAVTSK